MRRISIIAAAVLLSAACTGDPEVEVETGGTAACDPDLAAGLERWAEAGFSGSVAIGDAEGPSCLASFGAAEGDAPNTEETVFAIGSVSKAFTAAAVYELIDAGTFTLEDTAGSLVAGLGGPASEATVEQLLLHTSGLAGSHGTDHEPLSREEAVAAISALETEFEPGADYLYTNAAYTLLALIIDEQSGSSYREYIDAEILTGADGERYGGFWDGEPAAPGPRAVGQTEEGPAESVGDFEGPHWAMEGNGDLAMSAADLAAWTTALFAGEIIAPEAVELLGATGFDHGEGATEIGGWVVVDTEPFGTQAVVSSGGGGDTGQEAIVAFLPDTGAVLTVTSNTAGVTAGELLEAVGPALAAGEPIPAPAERVEVDPEELQAREGVYLLETGGSFTVTAADGALTVTAEGADAAAAMFDSADLTVEDAADHEAAVLALLEGGTEAGDAERAAVEETVGAIESVETAGTIVAGSELHTYVRFTGATGSLLAWYALAEHDEIAGVAFGIEPPMFTLVPAGEGEYQLEDLAGTGAGVAVVFDQDLMSVEGPAGSVDAQRQG